MEGFRELCKVKHQLNTTIFKRVTFVSHERSCGHVTMYSLPDGPEQARVNHESSACCFQAQTDHHMTAHCMNIIKAPL